MFKKLFLACLALVLVSGCSSKPKYSYNLETFPECIVAQEELTVDNWQNYIDIKTYEGPDFDQNGNPREDINIVAQYLSIKDDKMYIVDSSSSIEFEYDVVNTSVFVDQNENPIEEPSIYEYHETSSAQFYFYNPIASLINSGAASDEEHFTTDQYGNDVVAHISSNTEVKNLTVTKVEGTVYTLEIPEDKWYTDENGERYLIVYDEIFNQTHHLYENGIVFLYIDGEEVYNNTDIFEQDLNNAKLNHPFAKPSKNDILSKNWSIDMFLLDYDNPQQ